METTKLIFEFLAGGTIFSLSLLFMIESIFPTEWQEWMQSIINNGLFKEWGVVISAGVLTAIVYAVGVITEHIGEATFEWWMNRIKKRKFETFLDGNSKLVCSPLREYFIINTSDKEEFIRKNYQKAYGHMRFYVMANNGCLAEEITSQISRFRLIRVTCWAELFVIVGLISRLFQAPSGLIWMGLMIMIILLSFNIYTVQYRFGRYIRSIERSYKILTMERAEKESQEISRMAISE